MSDSEKRNFYLELVSKTGVPVIILGAMLYITHSLISLSVEKVFAPMADQWILSSQMLTAAQIETSAQHAAALTQIAESMKVIEGRHP